MHGKQIVVESRDFTLYVEQAFGYPWAHCDVRRWAPSVKRELLAALARLGPLLVLIDPPGNEKLAKFAASLGFGRAGVVEGLDGLNRAVYRREVNHG